VKYVTATRLTFDASVGRIEPGETYFVEDDKAERWVNAGVATEGKPPPQRREEPKPAEPEPEPTPQPIPAEPDDEEPEEEPDDERIDEVRRLSDQGYSQRQIAEELGVSRGTVRKLLGLM
jgi:DNA-binding NarL/FixJ family response regulator